MFNCMSGFNCWLQQGVSGGTQQWQCSYYNKHFSGFSFLDEQSYFFALLQYLKSIWGSFLDSNMFLFVSQNVNLFSFHSIDVTYMYTIYIWKFKRRHNRTITGIRPSGSKPPPGTGRTRTMRMERIARGLIARQTTSEPIFSLKLKITRQDFWAWGWVAFAFPSISLTIFCLELFQTGSSEALPTQTSIWLWYAQIIQRWGWCGVIWRKYDRAFTWEICQWAYLHHSWLASRQSL